MKYLSLVLVCTVLIAGALAAEPSPASAKSRYDRLLKSSSGREKLARIARMEEAASLDPATVRELAADKEPLVRARFAEALGRIGDPSAVSHLALLSADKNDLVAATAAYSLGLVGDTAAIEPLRRCLARKSETVRMRALEALGKTGKKEAAPVIAPFLRHFDSSVRAQAAFALAFTADSASAQELDAIIHDPDAHVAASAAYAMGRLGYKAGIDYITALLASTEAEARFRAVEALARLKAASAVRVIAPLTKDGDRWVALKAAEAIGRIGSSRGADALAEILSSPDPALKTVALGSLAAVGEKKHYDTIEPLLRDPSAMVRRAALGAAAQTDGDRAREALLGALERGTPRERSTALELLGTIGNKEDLPLLARMLDSADDHLLREGAAAGLGSWPEPDDLEKPCGIRDDRGGELTPLDILLEAANGDDWVVASIAVESLGKTAAPEMIPGLLRIFGAHADFNDGDRRLAVVEAIGTYAGKIKTDQAGEFGLGAFFARACADADARVASAASAAAAKFNMKLAAAPAGKEKRGTYPWGEPSQPLGTKKILVSTSRGDIEIELFGDEAPNVVRSILTLAAKGFYNGLAFHRVVPGFVIQGGCPRGDGWGDAGYLLRNQVNMHRYERGTVGMADSGKDTAGSQFFITHTPQPHLNGRYVIVGKVTRGMNVVDAIEEGDTFRVAVVE